MWTIPGTHPPACGIYPDMSDEEVLHCTPEFSDYQLCPAPSVMGGMDSEWENYGGDEDGDKADYCAIC